MTDRDIFLRRQENFSRQSIAVLLAEERDLVPGGPSTLRKSLGTCCLVPAARTPASLELPHLRVGHLLPFVVSTRSARTWMSAPAAFSVRTMACAVATTSPSRSLASMRMFPASARVGMRLGFMAPPRARRGRLAPSLGLLVSCLPTRDHRNYPASFLHSSTYQWVANSKHISIYVIYIYDITKEFEFSPVYPKIQTFTKNPCCKNAWRAEMAREAKTGYFAGGWYPSPCHSTSPASTNWLRMSLMSLLRRRPLRNCWMSRGFTGCLRRT
jgi:hypothetical protein